jgi:hypothetical protein
MTYRRGIDGMTTPRGLRANEIVLRQSEREPPRKATCVGMVRSLEEDRQDATLNGGGERGLSVSWHQGQDTGGSAPR